MVSGSRAGRGKRRVRAADVVAWAEALEDRRLLSVGTVTTLCASTYTSVTGTSVTFTAMVSASARRELAPSGTVRFDDSSSNVAIGTATLSGGTASFTTSSLVAGSHPITAVYYGDGTFSGSSSAEVTEEVTRRTVVDLLVVYTPEARLDAGGTFGMQRTIEDAVDGANIAYGNSRIDLTLRLVHSEEVSYQESGKFDTDLDRLTDGGDGYMDSVQAMRDRYGADMVSLMVGSGDLGGLAWILKDTGGDAGRAYSVVLEQQAAGPTYTLAHELGHNFGAAHDAAQEDGAGLFSYSYGYKFRAGGVLYRDIMSYSPGEVIPYFSNPDVSYDGMPTGTANANNARTISLSCPTVSRYRDSVMTGMATTTTTLLASSSGVVMDQPVMLTAVVLPQDARGGQTAGGTVMFRDGTKILGTGTVSNGSATWTGPVSGLGIHALSAIYEGDGDTGASLSAPAAFRVAGSGMGTDGIVNVYGTDLPDLVKLNFGGGIFNVRVNGVLQKYDPSLVTGIALYGYGGDDTITVGEGVLMGVSIAGGRGNDSLTGGSGNDLITDGKGDNAMWGMAGNDTLRGGAGNDQLNGGVGDDSLAGRAGNDVLRGAGGNDVLVAGPGLNRLVGCGGNDTLYGANGEADVLSGGLGEDSVLEDAGMDTLIGVEVMLG